MKILSCSLDTIDIRLTQSLSTARGSLGDRSGISLRLETADFIGWGSSAPIPGSSGSGTLEALASEIDAWARSAEGVEAGEALANIDAGGISPLARFAVHTALADLASQAAGLPLHQWLRAGSEPVVNTNALVTASAPKDVHGDVAAAVSAGFSAVKLKVAAAEPTVDATRIIAASEACGPSVELRLDANGGWSAEEAVRVIGRVGRHRVSYLEDPTPDPADFANVASETGVAVAHDVGPADARRLTEVLDRSGASVLVTKAAAVGGIDRIMEAGRSLGEGQRLIVSSSIDDPIGLLAGLHVAAALPSAEAHGLATASIVRRMPERLEPVDGAIQLPGTAGLGHPLEG